MQEFGLRIVTRQKNSQRPGLRGNLIKLLNSPIRISNTSSTTRSNTHTSSLKGRSANLKISSMILHMQVDNINTFIYSVVVNAAILVLQKKILPLQYHVNKQSFQITASSV